MSFSSQQKDNILREQIRSSCCLKALFEGILVASGKVVNDKVHLVIAKELAPYLQSYCADIYSVMLESIERKAGGRRLEVAFRSGSAKRFLLDIDEKLKISPTQKCPMCFSYFLKGFFLVSGMVSDPNVEYRLEFTPLQDEGRILALCELMLSHGIELKRANRHGQVVLYTKRSASIEDFFALANMNAVTFELMNFKIEHEIRNNANRVSNCEMSNIEKAVTASSRQLAAITELAEAGLLSSLPEELEETARLRLQYPDLSVSQLASMMTPAITKSGMVHRLNRIMKRASELLSSL